VTAVFRASGSSVGVGEGVDVGVGDGEGDTVGVGVGDGEGEGDGVGAGAVRRNNATPKRLHNRIITIAPTSVFFTAFSPSIIWLISPFGKAHARAQQPCYLTLRLFVLLLRFFPLKKLLQNRSIISQQAAGFMCNVRIPRPLHPSKLYSCWNMSCMRFSASFRSVS
jgi:hypothetical protein